MEIYRYNPNVFVLVHKKALRYFHFYAVESSVEQMLIDDIYNVLLRNKVEVLICLNSFMLL